MQFVVPQFIDIEPKIFGPITPRQFIVLTVTGGLIFVAYKLSDFTLFVILGPLLLAIGGTIAFLKINGRPIHYFALNFIQTNKRPKLRLWRKDFTGQEFSVKVAPTAVVTEVHKKPLLNSRLSDLSLLVDTGGTYEEE